MSTGSAGNDNNGVERTQYLEDIRDLENYISDIWQFLPIPVAYLTPQGVIIDANDKLLHFLHYSKDDLSGKRLVDIGPEQEFLALQEKTLAQGQTQQYNIEMKDRNGNTLYTDICTFARKDQQDRCIGFFLALIDCTKRKTAEDALRHSEQIYREMIDDSLVGVYKVNLHGDYIYVNDAMVRMFGFESQEAMVIEGVPSRYHSPEARDRFIEKIKADGKIVDYELELVTRCGRVIHTLVNATLEGDIISGMMMDITERTRNIELERLILQTATNFINRVPGNIDAEIDQTLAAIGQFTGVDRSYLFTFSQGIETMTNTHEWCRDGIESHIHRLKNIPVATFPWIMGRLLKQEIVNVPRVSQLTAEAVNEKQEFELEDIRSILLVQVSFAGKPIGFVGLDAVTSEKKWTEEAIDLLHIISNIFANAIKHIEYEESLQRSEERFRRLADNAKDMVFRYRYIPDITIEYISPSVVNLVGYTPEELYKDSTFGYRVVHPDDAHKLRELVEAPSKIKGPITLRWFHKNGSTLWFELQSTVIRDAAGNIIALEGIARDVTERMKAEQKAAESYRQLKNMVDGTVNALASTAEQKDPYTAGHQRRVTQLATAISRKMGLHSDRIEGIRVAGLLHDIGKVYVPAEILSKPTVLSHAEYSIVKTHAQIGHEILKNIEFPWPVTTIVIQHHERLNGSGYPNSLMADDIILETRIITVADVVEAMASHRPYRPAPGINAALEEIRINRGILYDPAVVECCLELFLKDGFKFD